MTMLYGSGGNAERAFSYDQEVRGRVSLVILTLCDCTVDGCLG